MNRLSKEQKEHIKELKNKGLSLRSIQKITEFPLSTIQYNLNKNSGKRRIKAINIKLSNFQIGEIVGAFAGDGSFQHNQNGRSSKYFVKFYFSYENDEQYKNYIITLLKNIGLNPKVYVRYYQKRPSSFEIRVASKKFVEFLREYLFWEGKKVLSIRLRRKLDRYSLPFLLGFTRGVIDTDGFVCPTKTGCGVVSAGLINNIKNILNRIGIKSKVYISKSRKSNWNDIYLLIIPKKYLNRFSKMVGLSNKRKKHKLDEIMG